MTAPIATARSAAEFFEAYQLRMQQLQVTGGEVERAIPLTTGHISQMFKARPTKGLGNQTFENMNDQLGVMWVMIENPATLKYVARLQKAGSPGMLSVGRQKVVVVKLTRRRMQKLGKLGTKGRMKKMTPAARRRVARKAAKARWHPEKPAPLPRSGLPVSGMAHLTNAERMALTNGGEKV